jgi:5-methylcytosine-specific restriction endonuclease McrA
MTVWHDITVKQPYVRRQPRTVLDPDWERHYQDYLASPEWRAKREAILNARGRACKRCSRTDDLLVHHRHDRTLGNERPEDCEVLCPPCHEQADEERAAASSDNLHYARLAGWASKKYGDDWMCFHDVLDIVEEFER